jgi:hypothetical protein
LLLNPLPPEPLKLNAVPVSIPSARPEAPVITSRLEEKKKKRPHQAPVPKEAVRLQELDSVEKDHGRLEIRRYYQSDYLDWFADQPKWEKLRTVGMVESMRQVDEKTTLERRYYLSSLKLEVETFARAMRGLLGSGEQSPMGDGRLFWRGPESRARRSCRREFGHSAPIGLEPIETGEN